MPIDLNADVGESLGPLTTGDDAAILRLVSSASVACGFHAGDASTARRTCLSAARSGVAVGAHVSYRDRAGFGRRFIDVDPAELVDEVIYQIGALQAVAAAAGTLVRYVKPHGALYNAIAHHRTQARAVAEAVRTVDRELPILVLPGTVIEEEAREAGLRPVPEAFADRAYQPDGTLVPRSRPGAVITDPARVAARVVRLATTGTVEAVDGTTIHVPAQSVCVHGDTPGAVAVATAARAALDAAGVPVTGFR